MPVAEVIEINPDGRTVGHGLFEFDILPVAGDRLSLADGDPEVQFEVIQTYHYPTKRPTRPTNHKPPHTRLLVKIISDEEAKYGWR